MGGEFGGDEILGPATMRGRDWPCLRQFCIFLENRVGALHELLRSLEREDLRVLALTIVESVDFAVVRVIVDLPERAVEILDLQGIRFTERDVLAVELPRDPQPYLAAVSPLVRAELNIHYTYPLLLQGIGRGVIVLCVDDVEMAAQVLRESGRKLLTEGDLLDRGDLF